mmetsp:Transcript_841/g.2893  ORF Transcript_841/g.2893 Transcript_841/m.2893 type:complete len:222 (-) Transcript_841:594-1259(-)
MDQKSNCYSRMRLGYNLRLYTQIFLEDALLLVCTDSACWRTRNLCANAKGILRAQLVVPAKEIIQDQSVTFYALQKTVNTENAKRMWGVCATIVPRRATGPIWMTKICVAHVSSIWIQPRDARGESANQTILVIIASAIVIRRAHARIMERVPLKDIVCAMRIQNWGSGRDINAKCAKIIIHLQLDAQLASPDTLERIAPEPSAMASLPRHQMCARGAGNV